jgi:hypothetical protein
LHVLLISDEPEINLVFVLSVYNAPNKEEKQVENGDEEYPVFDFEGKEVAQQGLLVRYFIELIVYDSVIRHVLATAYHHVFLQIIISVTLLGFPI